MRLTPAILEAAYALLMECPPFTDWPLPEAHDVKFQVVRRRTHSAESVKLKGKWHIRVNESWCGTLSGLIVHVMHEMCHVAHGEACPSDYAHHGKWFHALAAEVCKVHLCDPKSF